MRLVLAFTALLAATTSPAGAQETIDSAGLAGKWTGTLTTPGGALPLIFALGDADGDGNPDGNAYSPAQSDQPLPLGEVALADGILTLTIPMVGASYEGRYEEGRFVGTFRQGGAQLPLTLTLDPEAELPEEAALPADHVLPAPETVAALLDPVVAEHDGMAVAVALIALGREDLIVRADPATGYDGDTRFEIGSITKSMTGLLLASLAADGTVALDDPVNRYLPETAQLPDGADGRAITLADLARHRAGLPRLPADFSPSQPFDPYAHYDIDALHASIAATSTLESEPGETVAYSNFGAAILGAALARAAGTSYAALLEERLFVPLGLEAVIGNSSEGTLAQPHGRLHQPQSDWDLGAFAPAGGVRADIADMARFARLYLERPAAFAEAIALLFEGGDADGLGLFRRRFGDREIVWHNGATGGSRAMMALDPDRGEAVVVMVNSHAGINPDHLAVHLLTGRPLP
ncbi:serine hydrolase domain-containing protein [Sphingomicrobium astaxanthinifaciens]|uniref:serine hydrolase domain-containing protein n=1 Tax=Sphingomicrobium astaxanthinifaciens TaxID=1227949 RepID=UPI001FCB1BE9|nr:serine hydrolase domain-containing protein [Sphingomicrobium astaxanthinifaciens]MCJ7420471.1 beta-lactamase family protein [Sphingomicrobium astaxanthinifaciens]